MHRRRHGDRGLRRTELKVRRLRAALMLLLASPLGAQAGHGNQPPAAGLASNEEARRYFQTLQSHPLTDEALERALQLPSIRRIDEAIERRLARGNPIPGWRHLGVDIRGVIASRDGGPAGNMAEEVIQSNPGYTYFVDRPIETFVAPAWLLIGRRGAAVSGENIEVSMIHLSPKVIFIERVAYRREGNAYCRVQADSRLYADPAIPASQADVVQPLYVMRLLAINERIGDCEVTEDLGGGEYRVRHVDPEGRPTPDDASPHIRIVPLRLFPETEPMQ